MLPTFGRALLTALGLLELLTALLRMPLLGWFGRRGADLLAGLVTLALAARRGDAPAQRQTARRWAWPWAGTHPLLALCATAAALLLQPALASLRGLRRGPLQLFDLSGPARCQQLWLPLRGGVLPGLLLHPRCETRAAVLLLHGAGDSKSAYSWRLIQPLLDQGLAVLAIDLDGHGENQRTLDVACVAENIEVAAGWLRERYQRVAMVGVSLGGSVAASAIAAGVPADALVVIESPIALELPPGYLLSELRALLRPAFCTADDRATVLLLLSRWSRAPIRSQLSTRATLAQLQLRESLARVRCPTLLVYGTGDVIAPPAYGLALLRAAPDALLLLAPGAGHLSLTMERVPVETIALWVNRSLIVDR